MMSRDDTLASAFLNRKWLYYIIAALIYFGISRLHLNNFSYSAQQTLAVFGVAAFLWMTEALPLAVTGIVVLLLLPITGAVTATQTYSYFGNSAVFFILGAFILASPVMRSGLSTRIAITIITTFGKTPMRLLASIFFLGASLSFIISEHAVAAMLFPIVLEIIEAAGIKPGSRFGFAAFMALAWGAATGGTATLLGGARAPLALGMLESSTSHSISFMQWTLWVIPIVILTLAFAFLTLYLIARKSNVSIDAARAKLELHHTTLGKISAREKYTVFVIGLTVILWILYGKNLGLDLVAFFGVILAFALRIAHWNEVEQDVKWSIFLMYGSAIALSAALRDTGAANALVQLIINTGIQSPFMIFAILVVLAFFLTEAMSNAAAVAVLMPIGLALAQRYHLDPRAITVALATSAGLTFMLPVSTPAMAIATSTDYATPTRALRWGILVKCFGLIAMFAVMLLYWPLVGLNV